MSELFENLDAAIRNYEEAGKAFSNHYGDLCAKVAKLEERYGFLLQYGDALSDRIKALEDEAGLLRVESAKLHALVESLMPGAGR